MFYKVNWNKNGNHSAQVNCVYVLVITDNSPNDNTEAY